MVRQCHDEISAFLNKANPNWGLSEMKTMMNDHLKLTTDEAVQRIHKDYDADVLAYDKVLCRNSENGRHAL